MQQADADAAGGTVGVQTGAGDDTRTTRSVPGSTPSGQNATSLSI